MKICSCGYQTDNPSVMRCDKCGSYMRPPAEEQAVIQSDTDTTEDYVSHEIPVIYRSDVGLGGVFFIILICLSTFVGYTIYKTGLPALIPDLLALGIGLILSLILITIVCLLTANVMGISFGTLGSFIVKMTAIILVADVIILLIPFPFVGAIISFVVFIAMVERYFKLQWDGLVAFIIIVSIVYILGRLWLHGFIEFLIEHLSMGIILVWRLLLVMLST